MISAKEYYCPLCGVVSNHSTNHNNEIYVKCYACGSSVLYCRDSVLDTCLQVHLNHYRFNTANDSEHHAYSRLVHGLKLIGYRTHRTHVKHEYAAILRTVLSAGIHLPPVCEGQYVSSRGRLFNWAEFVWPNNKIKHGYYLTRADGSFLVF